MTIESQAETKDGTRLRLSLSTANLETHSRIQELSADKRMDLEEGLQAFCRYMADFISANTTKKTA